MLTRKHMPPERLGRDASRRWLEPEQILKNVLKPKRSALDFDNGSHRVLRRVMLLLSSRGDGWNRTATNASPCVHAFTIATWQAAAQQHIGHKTALLRGQGQGTGVAKSQAQIRVVENDGQSKQGPKKEVVSFFCTRNDRNSTSWNYKASKDGPNGLVEKVWSK